MKPTKEFDVFLSHNSHDKPLVEKIAQRLVGQAKLRPFLDKWHLIPGVEWQPELEDALRLSKTVAVFIGPSGNGSWHHEEMQVALKRAVREKKEFRVIPVLLPEGDASSMSDFLQLRTWVDFSVGTNNDIAFKRLVAGILGKASEFEGIALPDEPAPYRGLLQFKPEHARFFFGREQEIGPAKEKPNLIDKLRTNRFVAVVGSSGSGKSSIVGAGLLPRLAQDAIPGSRHWRTITFTPADDPFRSLANTLASPLPASERGRTVTDLLAQFDAPETGLRHTLETWFADTTEPLLLFVDQFEELFTHAPNVRSNGAARDKYDERIDRFLRQLAQEVLRPDGRFRSVITVRADFYPHCLRLPDLKSLLQDRQLLLGELAKDDAALREVIQRPAQEVGAMLETGLMDVLLADVRRQTGALPLLEHALSELWRNRRGPWLTLDAYKQSGGVSGALERRAEETFQRLTELQQRIARRIFVKLTSLEEDTENTRRRVNRQALYAETIDTKVIDDVIKFLADDRLIVTDIGSLSVAHETLIQNWPRLRTWLDEDRQLERIHRELERAADNWNVHARSKRHLFHATSAKLAETEEHATALADRITTLEREFLTACRQERYAESRRLRRNFWIAAGVAIFTLGMSGLAAFEWWQESKAQTEANRQTQIAKQQRRQSMGVAAEALAHDSNQGMEALALAVEAVGERSELPPPSGVTSGLVAALAAARRSIPIRGVDGHPLRHAVLLPDARFVVTADKAGSLRLWETATGSPGTRLEATSESIPIEILKVAPDSATILTTSKNTARLWSIEHRKPLFQLEGHMEPIVSAAYSPNSTRIVTGDESGLFHIWDVPTGRLLWTLPKHDWGARLAVFSVNGKSLLTAGGRCDIRFWDVEQKQCMSQWKGKPLAPIFSPHAAIISRNCKQAIIIGTRTIVLWNTVTGEPIRTQFIGDRESALAADWSHEYPLAIMAPGQNYLDGTTELYNGETGALLARFDHAWRCSTAAFSVSGDWAVTGGEDRVVRVWRRDPYTKTWQPSTALAGHEDYVASVEISADCQRVLSRDQGGTARIWNLAADQARLTITPPKGVSFAAYSDGGTRLISVDQRDWVLRCWDARTGERQWMKLIKTGSQATVSPDGTQIVVTNIAGQFALHDAINGKLLRVYPVKAAMSAGARFSQNGQRVVFISEDQDKTWAEVWSLTGAQPIKRFKAPRGVSAAFAVLSPDGSMAVVTADKSFTLYSVDGDDVKELPHNSGHSRFFEAEFSPDGRRIVAPCLDGTATLWDSARGTVIARAQGHKNAVIGAHFSRDGARIVTVGEDAVAMLWEGSTGQPLKTLVGHAGMLTDARFSLDGSRVLTCSRDGTARLWDAETGDQLGVFGQRFDVEAALGAFSPDGSQVLVVRRVPNFEAPPIRNNSLKIYPATVGQMFKMAAPLLRHQPQFARVQRILDSPQ